MEFRLVYGGEHIRASGNKNSRTWEKHQIRRYFSPQLKRLWETHPILQFYLQPVHAERGGIANRLVRHEPTQLESIANHFEGFVPVVNGDFGMFCELDILFLRPEPAGGVIKRDSGGGDIDNRIKTLFDALSIPQRGAVPTRREDEQPDPIPMFVLLSDDSLITSVKITTDRLLSPQTDQPEEAVVIIHASVTVVDPLRAPYGVPV